MKKNLSHLIVFLFVLSVNGYGQGGTTYSPSLDLYINGDTGGLWHSRSASQMDSMIRNQMTQQQQFGQMMLSQAIGEELAKKIDGEAKIKAGKATTRITYSPNNSIINQTGKSQTSGEIGQSADVSIKIFNNILKAKNLIPYDSADGSALAFALSYLAYNDENPGDARLVKLRQFFRTSILKSTLLQGTSDAEKQQTYEKRAFRTILAIRAYETSKRMDITPQEKQIAQTTTRDMAESVLKELWTGNVGGIELSNSATGFADKGARIVKSGGTGATTAFARTEDSSWAKRNAYCFRNNKKVEGDISCFYEYRNEFDKQVSLLGGQNNDLAYGNAVAFKLSYEAYTLGKVKLNDKQFAYVLAEMQKDIKGSPDFQSQSDKQKQESYDGLVFGSITIYKEYQEGIADQRAGNGLSADANLRHAKSEGFKLAKNIFQPRNLDDYELQANGFVKVR